MSFTETTSRSWFGRMKSAFSNIFVGILMFLAAGVLLFWNEGRAVKRYQTLKEGSGLVISAPSAKVEAANEGKLIHTSGKAVTKDVLRDNVLNIAVNALRLKRKVEMRQWVEKSDSKTKKKLGGSTETTTTYSYKLEWSTRQIDSANFRHPQGHENNLSFPIASTSFDATNVTLGAFKLNPSQIGRIGKSKPLALSLKNAPRSVSANVVPRIVNGIMYLDTAGRSGAGDVRVSASVTYPTEVSLVARQNGNSFRPYKTSVGGTISLLQTGVVPADEMFQAAVDQNATMTWVLRVVGFVMMFIGLKTFLSILSVTADIIPIVGSIVGAGAGVVAFLGALIVSTIIIAIAWIFFRPLLAFGLIAVAVIAGVAMVWRGKGAKSEAPAAG